MVAFVPQLSGREWRCIDAEIATERYFNPNKYRISSEDEPFWAQIAVQGLAALETSPFEHTLTRLTRLKLQKPTQYMDEHGVSVFWEDICEHLERRGYSYYAIDQGIMQLIEREDDRFFPTMKVLLKYIHPLHWTLKNRIDKIIEILKRNHKKTSLSIDNK
jgi:hypothetical protein